MNINLIHIFFLHMSTDFQKNAFSTLLQFARVKAAHQQHGYHIQRITPYLCSKYKYCSSPNINLRTGMHTRSSSILFQSIKQSCIAWIPLLYFLFKGLKFRVFGEGDESFIFECSSLHCKDDFFQERNNKITLILQFRVKTLKFATLLPFKVSIKY